MELNKDCIFCNIVKGKIPSKKVFENDNVVAFLDIFPISQGHTVIIPKSHYGHFEDVNESSLVEVFRVAQVIGRKYLKISNIEGFNVLINNHPAAGQVVNHFHLHIVPREADDGLIRHKIPKEQATEEELEDFLERFRKI